MEILEINISAELSIVLVAIIGLVVPLATLRHQWRISKRQIRIEEKQDEQVEKIGGYRKEVNGHMHKLLKVTKDLATAKEKQRGESVKRRRKPAKK